MPSLLPELGQLSNRYRLEPIAAYLADTILNYQNEGPYYLGGWSDGGVLAYETARQLAAESRAVALLVMFDSVNPTFRRSALDESWLKSRARKMKFRAQQLLKLKLKNVRAYISEKVIELRRQIQCSAWRITAKNHGRLEDDVRESAGRILYLGVDSYRPAPYSGRLIYFKAPEHPPGNKWDNSRGCLHLVNGELDVYEVPVITGPCSWNPM